MNQNVSGKLSESDERGFVPIKLAVRMWLIIGLVMVFFQIIIGGVTRLTDSGLSITEWAIIQGTIPPIGESAWNDAFDLYKFHAKKQFESLHADMTLSEFKVIYFWEYFHRLWARLMGFVFILPFVFFLVKGWLPKWLIKRLGVVIALAVTVAVFGWLMVSSGLNADNRTWVSAYKLIIHLGLASALFCYLFLTWLKAAQPEVVGDYPVFHRQGWLIAGVLMLQILFGGLMAGMRAGLIHPYWPVFIEGERFLSSLKSMGAETNGFINYEAGIGIKAWVQLIHRFFAFLLTGLILWWVVKLRNINSVIINKASLMLVTLLVIQFMLGILTIINCIGSVPVSYGAAHQGVALLLFISLLFIIYQLKPSFPHNY